MAYPDPRPFHVQHSHSMEEHSDPETIDTSPTSHSLPVLLSMEEHSMEEHSDLETIDTSPTSHSLPVFLSMEEHSMEEHASILNQLHLKEATTEAELKLPLPPDVHDFPIQEVAPSSRSKVVLISPSSMVLISPSSSSKVSPSSKYEKQIELLEKSNSTQRAEIQSLKENLNMMEAEHEKERMRFILKKQKIEEEESYEVAKSLLENGAEPNMQTYIGVSLVLACKEGHYEVAKFLLENGADPNMENPFGQPALLTACMFQHREVAELLLDKGAKINSQNAFGYTALHCSVKEGSGELIKLLLDRGAQPNILSNNGESALIVASGMGDYGLTKLLLESGEVNNTNLWLSLKRAVGFEPTNVTALLFEACLQAILKKFPLKADSAYPGILFFEPLIQKSITHVESTIESEDAGISVSIPGGALSPDEEPVDMLIHPCFSGPFELPDGYEPSSPAYLVKTSRRVKFHKDITIKMHHYAVLTSNEDCDEMVFLSAKSNPHLRESGPVYVFREVAQLKGLFRAGTQVGEIALQHFCLLKAGRKRAREESGGNHLKVRRIKAYSARLYRNLSPTVYPGLLAVFCMCLQHPVYIEYCNKRIEGYDDISAKEEARTVVTAQEIVDEVELKFIKSKGWKVSFDMSPAKIKKEDIEIPKEDIELLDYPPKAKIYVDAVSTDGNSSSPQLLVKGLDGGQKKLKLIIPSTSTSHLSLSPSTLSPSSLSPSTPSPSTLSQGNQTSTIVNTEQDRTGRTLRDEPLDKQSVLTELLGITREWSNLGMVLGLEEHEIDTIKENHHRIEDCRREMVAKLLKNDPPLSWTTLCEALRHKLVKRPDIARTIEKKLTN